MKCKNQYCDNELTKQEQMEYPQGICDVCNLSGAPEKPSDATVTLTHDQIQFLLNVTDLYLENGVHQERLAFAQRIRDKLAKAKS